MAYHPDKGLQDLYSGRTDLQQGILRCVGVPDVRFHEDALRILRALRFSAVLGFSLEEQTTEIYTLSLHDALPISDRGGTAVQ